MSLLWKINYVCRKEQGYQPTGFLYCNAKESGFEFVSGMLAVKEVSKALRLGKVNETTVLSWNEPSMKKVHHFFFITFPKSLMVHKFG